MRRTVLAIACFALALAAVVEAGPCTALDGRKGQCIEPSQCRTSYVSGRCPGATPKCCLDAVTPTPVQPTTPAVGPACTDLMGNSGKCLGVNACTTGNQVSGRCPGAFKCCVDPVKLPANAFEARGKTMYFTLRTQAFPNNGFPGAVVYVPENFDNSRPLNIALFIHGFWNCINNVIRSTNDPVACTGSAKRRAYGLIDQVEAAGKNVLLVVAETSRDVASGNPGRLANANGLRDFLNELLGQKLAPVFGARTVSDINRLIVMGHSAAYQSTSAFAHGGGVAAMKEVHLLDSLYGYSEWFNGWITAHKNEFANGEYKFSNIYFSSTATNSVAQAKAVAKIAPANVYKWDQTTNAVPAQALFDTPVLFKASNVKDHDGIPATFVVNILRSSPI